MSKKKQFHGKHRANLAKQTGGKKLKLNLFGHHAVQAAWQNPHRTVHALYMTDSAARDFDLKTNAKRPQPTLVAKEDIDRSLPPGTVHQGVAMVCDPLPEVDAHDLIMRSKNKENAVILILDQVTDPHNVGAILRSACAFGADGMILQTRNAPDIDGVLAKTACGAVEHVPVAYETNLSRTIDLLKDHMYFVYGLDERGKDIGSENLSGKTVLVLGAEGSGLRPNIKDHCDVLVKLPMHGPMPSINVSNAAAVALYAINAKISA